MKNILKWFSILSLSATATFAAEPLLLQWGAIDTSGTEAQAESTALKAKVAKKAALARARKSAGPEERAAYIVQFPGPVTEEWRTWLEASTQVRGYLPEFAYLVWATATEMETIAANPDVFWTGEWKKDYKTVLAGSASPSKTTASATADEARWMHVGSLLVGDDGAADLRARIEALDTTVRSAFPRLDGCGAVAYLTDAQIDEISSWPDVQWIEPKLQPRLFNDQAARTNMMNVSNVWKSLSSGGLGLTGSGQIVAVADTGCDKGSTSDIHADFAGRVVAGYGWTNGAYKSSASWADLDAHGTHVCGSILGSGSKSSGQFKGMAYEAQLVMQGMWEDLGGLPDDIQNLFKQAYSAGARIHSDSWGYGTNVAGRYVYDAVDADGYMWTNQNFLAVFAAGNDGIDANSDGVIDAGSVSCPGTAKNVLCVGAAENYRSSGGYSTYGWGSAWSSDYPADPIKSDKISQTKSPQGLAAFSGRGPTKDGRFKPDIVAPGTDIISVRGRMAQDDGWGIYSSNTNYLYEGGTSMATPLTSGATALIRQWLVDRKGINEPMAALMKALLINGARDMTPGQYGTGTTQEITARPDRSQGFGHVNLYNSLEPGDGNFLVFVTNKLTASANFTTNIAVGQANAGKYVLTLAWQDYPGSSGASKTLVNDLDLTVTSPSGTVYYPNNLSTNDHVNNVEFIEFTATETGTYSVRVNGYSVSKTSPNNGQPFALVMRGPETVVENAAPQFSSSTATASGVLGEPLTFSFASLLTAGYPNPTYSITSTTAASGTYSLSSGILTFNPTAAGTFTFVCRASNSEGNATCTLTATISLPPPSAPTGLAVSGLSTTSFTASWNAAANAESYSLDVATVSGSATPSALISEDFSSSMGWTSSGTSYTSGTHEDANGTWTYENAIFHPSDSASSPGSAGNIQLQKNTYLYFPTVDNPTSVSINAKGSSTGSMILQQQVNGSWTVVETKSISSTVANYTITISDAGAATAFRVYSSDRALYLYDVTVTGASASYTSLTGYPKSVSGTSSSVTDLTPSTDYGVRVRSVNSAGTSDWTAWVAASTTAGDSAPVWATLPTPTVTVNNRLDFVPGDYLSGSPTPTVTLKSTTAPSGTYSYSGITLNFTPTAAGTYTFTFLASNSLGTATATLTVTASDFTPTSYAVSVGVNEYNTSYVPSSNWLEGCVPDATHIRQQITTRGDWAVTNVSYLTNAAATLANVRKAITNAAAKAVSGDKFLYYHSSHGDTGALCTYNSDYTKSQLATDLAKFKSGVKVVIMIDACHSASMYKSKGIKKTLDLADFAAQVSAEIDAIRADELARSVRRAVPRIASSEIGWITAADSDQYSWDGEDGGAFTEAVIEGWTNGICDNATYGNQDGYANFYELWNYAKDIATGQAASGEDHTDAQCTNVTVLTSTIAGWVGATAPVQNEPPAFSSSTASASGVVGSPVTFDFSTLLTAGSLPLTYYLPQASVSSYSFNTQTGVLTFTPEATGSFAFTCSVRNDYGTADCTLTVTVTLPPVTVPVLTVTNVTATGALASWTACDGVTSYTLQLASDDQFSTGGSGGTVTLFSNDATDPSAAPSDWTYNINNASGSYLQLMNGHYVVTEAFDASACLDLSLSLYMRTYGGTSYPSVTVQYSTDNGATWSDSLGTLSAANTTMAQRTLDVSAAAGSSSVRLRIASTSTSSSVGVGIKTIVLTGTESAGAGSIISTETVSGTSHTFTGLAPYTIYYARVKGNADWSNVAEFLTESAGDSAPVWSAIPAQTVDVGTNCWLNLADYVSGSPAPTITLVSTTADSGDYEFEDGYLMFAPPAGGTYTFDFTAANSVGSADATLTVTGHAEAPSLTASLGTSLSSTVGDNVEFTVTATGIPAPASIGATCTEGAYFVFENGAFLFDSPAVGTYHFVFTATTVAGTDTLTVTVEVSAAPVTVPTLTVTDVTDTTALASWTACDGVSSYTLQLSTNAFPAASGSARSATPILSEDFSGFSGNGTADIGNSLDDHTAITGWTGSKVYTASETVKVGASSGQGWLMTPALNASGTLTIVWAAYRYGTSDKDTLLLGVSENGTDFDEETVTIGDEMTGYTNTFTVSGPTVYVRWMASGSSKARFYLDNVLITNSGGDDPGGDDIQTFTSADTSHVFTNLSPYTIYYARVKGNADWSNVEEFLTEEEPVTGTAPSWSADFPTNWSMTAGDIDGFDVTEYVSGDPAPAVTLNTDAPAGDVDFDDGGFIYMPTHTGTFTFTFTASNDFGTADAVLVATVTGTAPSWDAAFPATDTVAAGEDSEIENVSAYVSGSPSPTVALTSASSGDCDFENDYFLFNTATPGTYTFVFTASNVLGTADATLTVTVTAAPEPPASDYEQWIADNDYPEEPESAIAANGETYYDNYIADIDPTTTNKLEIVPDLSTGATFTVPAASDARYYQFTYTTNLLEPPVTTNLGWGAASASEITFPADWYGSISVYLEEPAAP